MYGADDTFQVKQAGFITGTDKGEAIICFDQVIYLVQREGLKPQVVVIGFAVKLESIEHIPVILIQSYNIGLNNPQQEVMVKDEYLLPEYGPDDLIQHSQSHSLF